MACIALSTPVASWIWIGRAAGSPAAVVCVWRLSPLAGSESRPRHALLCTSGAVLPCSSRVKLLQAMAADLPLEKRTVAPSADARFGCLILGRALLGCSIGALLYSVRGHKCTVRLIERETGQPTPTSPSQRHQPVGRAEASVQRGLSVTYRVLAFCGPVLRTGPPCLTPFVSASTPKPSIHDRPASVASA